MVNIDTALVHHLFKITVSNRISQIEKHCEPDHRFWVMRALEVNHHHHPIISAKSPHTAPDHTGLHERPKYLRHNLKVSSHLYPEISSHLLAAIPNAHFLEYADSTARQFSGHAKPSGNSLTVSD
jgi:hypothetical protein